MPSGGRARPYTGPAPHEHAPVFGGAGTYPDPAAGITLPMYPGVQSSRAIAVSALETTAQGSYGVARFEAVPPGQRWNLEHLRVGHNGTSYFVGIGRAGTLNLSDVIDGQLGVPLPPMFSVLDCAPPWRLNPGEQLWVWFTSAGAVDLQALAQFTTEAV